jgi:plastocyanin
MRALLVVAMTAMMLSQASTRVVVRAFRFAPDTVVVRAGERLTWTNLDEIAHTVTSGRADSVDGRYTAALDSARTTFSRRFDEPGVYPYYCTRHPFMTGVVRVLPKGEDLP